MKNTITRLSAVVVGLVVVASTLAVLCLGLVGQDMMRRRKAA